MNSGKCHCGKVDYEVSGDKQFEFLCHCRDCQKINGGGNLAGIIFEKNKFNVQGETKKYTYPGGSGQNIEFHFCPNCGTPIYAFPKAHSEVVVIRANTLNNEKIFLPQKSLFAEEALSWDKSVKV